MSRGEVRDRLTFGRARRRRRMRRLLRELDRLDAQEALYGEGQWQPARPVSRTRAAGSILTAVAVVGATVLGGTYLVHRQEPLGTPPVAAAGSGTFGFTHHQPGRPSVPVTYSACEAIAYTVNDAYAPPGASEILDEAIREVSLATGLVFTSEGTTDDLPFTGPGMSLLGRHGPVVIAWTSAAEVPELAGDVAGLGGSTAVTVGADSRYVTGGVALDGPDITAILERPHGVAQARAIVMHELAHVVGLDHVDDRGELMHPENLGMTVFGPGDREGLAALGAGPCR